MANVIPDPFLAPTILSAEQLEDEASRFLGKLLFIFSRLEMNMALYLAGLSDDESFENAITKVAKVSFNGKLDLLLEAAAENATAMMIAMLIGASGICQQAFCANSENAWFMAAGVSSSSSSASPMLVDHLAEKCRQKIGTLSCNSLPRLLKPS